MREKASFKYRARFSRRLGLFLAFSCAGITLLLPSNSLAATSHEFEKAFGPDGTAGSKFSEAGPGPIATDEASGDLYVVDLGEGTVSKFDEGGVPVEFTAGPGAGSNDIGGFSFATEEALNQIAVSPPGATTSGDFYVATPAGSVKAFHPDGAEADFSATGNNELTGFGLLCGIAVDVNGDIYTGDESAGGKVTVFEPSGVEITSFSAPEACNLAVGSDGAVYVAPYVASGIPVNRFTPSAFPVTPATTYAPTAEIDSNRAFGVAVDLASDEVYVDEHTQIAQFESDGTPVGIFPPGGVPGALGVSEGLAVNGNSGVVYASGTVAYEPSVPSEPLEQRRQVEILVPPPPNPPSLGAISFSGVTATEADLQAQINPEQFKTSYHFEYLTEAEYLANGETFAEAKSTSDTNLGQGGTTQIAHAHIGSLAPDTTYRFRASAESENNEGSPVLSSEVGKFTTFPVFPAGLPDGRAYELVSPAQKGGEVFPPEPLQGLGSSCPSTECLPGASNQLMPMQSSPDGEQMVFTGQPFSAGLAAGPNEYLSTRGAAGWGTQSLSSPLFGSGNQGYQAFSTDLSRGVLFQVQPALSPGAPTKEGKAYPNLYMRDPDGSLGPLITSPPPNREPFEFNVLYAGANAGTHASPAFGHLAFAANDALTGEVPGIAPAAEDGGVVLDEKGFPVNLNLYEWAEGELRLINVAPGNTETAPGATIGSGPLLRRNKLEAPNFDHAISNDGSHIFWSVESSGQVFVRIDGIETVEIGDPGKFLTASADGSKVLLNDGCLYDLEAEECAGELAQGQGGFEGILGAAEDLSRIYFVDTATLTGSEENANDEEAEAGKFNLYAWDEGATSFIGALILEDDEFGSTRRYGDWTPSPQNRTAQVSPDGRYLAFMSRAPLTPGFENIAAGGGQCELNHGPLCAEVFEFAATSGQLNCVSCRNGGKRPLGSSYLSLISPGLVPFPQPNNLSAEGGGRLFFVSQDVLSPRDNNGQVSDVYEWEPNGVGSCVRSGGCVFLISSGTAANDSLFVNSTPSGNDAFIISRQKLLPSDKNDQLDLYDARVGGGFSETETAACGAEACKAPIAGPPLQTSAGSSEFVGPGNPSKHKKKHHKKKHHKKKHHKRSAKNSRGGGK